MYSKYLSGFPFLNGISLLAYNHSSTNMHRVSNTKHLSLHWKKQYDNFSFNFHLNRLLIPCSQHKSLWFQDVSTFKSRKRYSRAGEFLQRILAREMRDTSKLFLLRVNIVPSRVPFFTLKVKHQPSATYVICLTLYFVFPSFYAVLSLE